MKAFNRLLVVVALIALVTGWRAVVRTAPQDLLDDQLVQRSGQPPASLTDQQASFQQLVDRYCAVCHNQRLNLPAANPLHLDAARLDRLPQDAPTWERVIQKLTEGSMPPAGMPSPGQDALTGLREWLQQSLDRVAERRPTPGRYVAHRLNRSEYANAVRDLLSVEVDTTQLLPSDGGDHGFDNVATGLTASPVLIDRYLAAALRVSALAIGDPTTSPSVIEHTIGVDVTQNGHVEGLPLGTRGGALIRHVFPADGEYVLSARLLRTVAEGYAGVEGHEIPHQFVITLDGEKVYSSSVAGPDDHALNLNPVLATPLLDKRLTSPPVFITAGLHELGFTWLEQPSLEQAVWQPSLRASQGGHDASGLPRLRTLSIDGPYRSTPTGDSPSRTQIFVCRPTAPADESTCARQIVSTLAQRAFRRAVSDEDLTGPLAFYDDARAAGEDFDAGIRASVAGILMSPSFLFRTEEDPADLPVGGIHRVSDVELASRLSFFLWSSVPDQELLNLAIAGRLRDGSVLESQVRRMLADRRAASLVDNFVGQWLELRNLESLAVPNLTLFPDFDDNLRQAFRRETVMLFESVLREDRSVLNLLNADYTFVNERLARHYGIPGVYGTRFRRVEVPDSYRQGILGHGSLLALTSTATRTSPVLRGVYVLKNILNRPPNPPPPNVPLLEASAAKERPTTVRQQLEIHRANPSCATCHRNIDPLGFALENFDPVGQWRGTTDDGLSIDASSTLSDGTPVNGPVELRNAILRRPEVFASALTEKLLTYALGRGLQPYDRPTVRSIVREAARDDYRLTAILLGIVNSPAFQMRTKLGQPQASRAVASVGAP